MSNLIKFIKKYQLIIFLSLVAGLLLGFKILIVPNQEKTNIITPTPEPSPIPPTVKPTKRPNTPTPKTEKSPPSPISGTPFPNITPDELKKSPTPTLKGHTPAPGEETEMGITKEEFMKQLLKDFPLTPYLPYPDEEISIRYTGPLEIEITKNDSLSADDKKEIILWIEDQNVDPDSHEINWKVVNY